MNLFVAVINPLALAVAVGVVYAAGRLAGRPLTRQQVWDVGLLIGLLGIAQEEIWFPHLSFDNRVGPLWLAVSATTVAAAVQLGRRRAPLMVLAIVSTITLVRALVGGGVTGLGFLAPILVDTYAVGRYERRLPLVPAAVISAALAIGATLVDSALDPTHSTDAGMMAFTLLFMAVIWGLGRLLLRRESTEQALMERTESLERDREARAREAITEERARIARELHDVVAHNVSVIVVQAQAASAVLAERPEAAGRALERIEATARDAMGEMRHLVDILDTTDPSQTTPQPGVRQIPELLGRLRDAGLRVEFDSEGELDDLPSGLDLTVYRIVQEALTNIIRHSRARSVTVQMSRSRAGLEIHVLDDGNGSGAPARGGRGLFGMRERVTLYGGKLEAGPRPEGGFGVTAVIPVEPASA